ncbi:MAG: hypothetical protein K2O12_05865, partial [Muribaculaceae bacterium]|nr:hypothetical protein [Muribaculaceae bacterium]
MNASEKQVMSVQLTVEHVADIVYCHQALAARLSADVSSEGLNAVPLPARSQRGIICSMAMRELASVVCDLGLTGAFLPVDEFEATVDVGVRHGTAETFRRAVHDAAAYGVLSEMLAGINACASDNHR